MTDAASDGPTTAQPDRPAPLYDRKRLDTRDDRCASRRSDCEVSGGVLQPRSETRPIAGPVGRACAHLLVTTALLLSAATRAADLVITGDDIQKHANGVLALLGYSVVPDITASSLSISSAQAGDPQVWFSQFAGGFTISDALPLYLEGGIGFSRYDPTFIANDGTQERPIPLKWNSIAVTGGVGWDFPVANELVLRPIANVSLGRVASDSAVAASIIEEETGLPVGRFFDDGRLNAYGYGGSMMLDWEHYRPDEEIDVELRYTWIRLESFGGTSSAVEGQADVPTFNLWTRYRAPTGFTLLDRPLRYVLEYAYSSFHGDQKGVLGFNHLNSLGLGIEIDSSAYDVVVTRTRLVGRYRFGNNVTGFGIGLAVSF